ncbi:MAG: hypothetical protein H6598_01670 [Flavobacteriales bacterium]|nr:hypothetical protein [Flavobacteriales bacterium]
MGHPKDIFKNQSPLTEKEIQDYLSGNLTDEQRRKIELKMAQDEFNLAAMDGFETSGNGLAGFNQVRTQFGKTIHKKAKGWKFIHTIILSVILMIGTMFLGPFLFPDHGKNSMNPEIENDPINIENNEDIEIEDFSKVLELSDDEIEASITLEEFKLVNPKEVIVSSPITLDSSMTVTSDKKNKAIETSIELKTEIAESHPVAIEVPTKADIVYSNVPLIYMANYLLVDYSKILKSAPSIQKIELTGTSAALENQDDKLGDEFDTGVKTIEIPYLDYLMETQVLFDKHDFKGALKRYKVILSSYSEDLNAHFYSGLCYYNLGKYDLALKHLNAAKKHPFNTFAIDAQWYIAKTYYMQGKNETCKKHLLIIIEEGDFYSQQAKSLLEKIK